MHSRRWFRDVTVPVLSALALSLAPITAWSASFEQQLESAVEQFNARKKGAKKEVLQNYDKLLQAVQKQKNLEPDVKLTYLDALQDAKATFEESEQFTDDFDSLQLEIAYYTMLAEPYERIETTFDHEIKRAMRADDTDRAAALVKKRDELAHELLGIRPLASLSKLSGTLHRSSGRSIPYRLTLIEVKPGGIFDGTVDDNPGVAGHWRYKIHGQVKGVRISFRLTENLRGKITAFQADGIFVGDKLVAVVRQRVGKNAVETMYLVLRG